MDYVWVGLGGFAGANARFVISRWTGQRFESTFPYGTFIVNLTGALVVGIVLTLLTERFVADPRWRLLIVIGFLGGYTTFSSYAYEAVTLAERGHWLRAATYVLGSNLLGFAACITGIVLTRRLAGG